MTIFFIAIFSPILLFLAILYWPKRLVEQGIEFVSYPTSKYSHASFANPDKPIRGYTFSTTSDLKKIKYEPNGKNRVFVDVFRMDKEFRSKSRIPHFLVNRYQNFEVGFDPLKMTEALLLIGKMGSGKTEILFNFLNQDFYNRAIIHQVKSGDFVAPYYREGFDIILNPYDLRGQLWDVMSEDEGIIKTFFQNYMNAIMGDKKDFFSAAANRLYNEAMTKIKIRYENESSSVKWHLFIKAIKDLFVEMETGDQNSNKDVGSTMQQVIESLEIMAWQMQDPRQKKFTIKEFFAKKDRCKLILDNNAEYEQALTPLFSAFLACLTQVQLAQPDTKQDFTLYAIDEYLSLAKTMDESSKKRLHTLIRSKGGILMAFIQYVPKDNQSLQQLLTSSAYAWFIFSVIEEQTIELIKKTISQVEYVFTDENRNSKGSSYSTKEAKRDVLSNDILNSLAKEYAHIVYLPNEKLLFKGYTPQAYVPKRNEYIIKRDLKPFYAMKYASEEEQIDISSLKFEDLFKAKKKLSKLEEYKLYKKYQESVKNGNVADFKKEEIAKEFQTKNIDFELMFEKYIPKDKVISSKMKLLTPLERFKLKEEWNSFDESDAAGQLAFLEKHDLFGAVPNIFNIDESQLAVNDIKDMADDF